MDFFIFASEFDMKSGIDRCRIGLRCKHESLSMDVSFLMPLVWPKNDFSNLSYDQITTRRSKWIFMKFQYNFFYEPLNFLKINIGFNEVFRVNNWVCIYGVGNMNVLMVWEMFWVELNRRKRVFELKCCFKWLREISYVLAIEIEVLSWKWCFIFLFWFIFLLEHDLFGLTLNFLNDKKLEFETKSVFENNRKMDFLWKNVIIWLVYCCHEPRWSM